MNNREIKFRAWDGRQMRDSDWLVLNHIYLAPTGYGFVDRDLNKLGDIIIIDRGTSEESIVQVFYNQDKFDIKNYNGDEGLADIVEYGCEVIGNIFENNLEKQ